MSPVTSNAPTTIPPATSDPPVFLSPEKVVEQLRLLRDQIPDYVQLSKPSAASLRPVANLDPAFVQAAISTAGVSATLQGSIGQTAEGFQQDSELQARWSVVADELRAMLQGVQTGNVVRKHRLGLTALLTYSISRQLVRKPEHADLLPHVHTMKRMLKLGRRAKAAPQPGPQQPQPGLQPGPQPQPHAETQPKLEGIA